MAQWIYKLLPLKYGQNPLISEKEINYLAQEGWEVIAVYNNPGAIIMFRKKADGSMVLPSDMEEEFQGDEDTMPAAPMPEVPVQTASQKKEAPQETPLSFYNTGSSFLANGNFQEAIKYYDRAIEMDDNFTMAFVFRANARLKLHDWDKAILDFDKVLSLKPNDLPCHLNRGICKYEKGLYEEAIEDFGRVMALSPENIMAYEYRGQSLRKLKRYEEALADFEKVLKISPDDPEAYILRGELKVEMKDIEGGIEDYTFAIKKDASHARAYYKRSQANKMNGDEDLAKKDMKKYNELCTKIIKTRDSNWGEEKQKETSPSDENDEITLVDPDLHSEKNP